MPPLNDVFTPNAFTVYDMTAAINLAPVQPTRIGSMGLFTAKPTTQQFVSLEERHGIIRLLPTVPRGGPATKGSAAKRKLRAFQVPHIPFEDIVTPDEVNVRAFGEGTSLQAVQEVVNRKLADMRTSHVITHEYQRMGALRGRIFDSDGETTIQNLFNDFGVTQESTDFVFGTATTSQINKVTTVKRAIEAALGGGVMYDHIHCFAGATWFDSFTSHATVNTAFQRWRDGEYLRSDNRRGFEFGGVIFEEYTASVSGVSYLPATEARFFPVGVPGLFLDIIAPADFMETVGTLGKDVYAKQKMVDFERGIELHTQSNHLMLCTQPRVLHKGYSST